MGTEQSESRLQIRWLSLLLIASSISLLMVAVAWFYGYRDAPETINRILQASPADVQSITVRPSSYATLVTAPVVITDRRRIRRFVQLARSARVGGADHPQSRWRCHISVADSTGISHCTVSQTLSQGTMIYVHTGQSDGLMLGIYRCDDLAPFLEELTEAVNRNSTEMDDEE